MICGEFSANAAAGRSTGSGHEFHGLEGAAASVSEDWKTA